jgi:hypothetical protein
VPSLELGCSSSDGARVRYAAEGWVGWPADRDLAVRGVGRSERFRRLIVSTHGDAVRAPYACRSAAAISPRDYVMNALVASPPACSAGPVSSYAPAVFVNKLERLYSALNDVTWAETADLVQRAISAQIAVVVIPTANGATFGSLRSCRGGMGSQPLRSEVNESAATKI